jgi:hypothetical protein
VYHWLTSRSAARLTGIVAALGVAFVISATPAHAQNQTKVSIDFAFVAGTQAMEPGAYEIEATRNSVIVRSVTGKTSVIMPVLTQLGRHDNDAEAELIFDKVAGKVLLSEFWYPGADGYLLVATPVDHEHRVLGGSRPHK